MAEPQLTDRIPQRYRPLWESMESGTRLVMRRPFYFWGLWLCAALPVYLIFFLLCLAQSNPLALLWLIWWAKPVFEGGMLAVLADEVHSKNPPAFSGSLKKMWQTMFHRQLFANLFWRRLSWRRSTVLPVAVLENARGSSYRRRCRQIGRKTVMQSGWLTFLGVHFEMVLTYGILGMIAAVMLNIFSVGWTPFDTQIDNIAGTLHEFWLWQGEAEQRWLLWVTAAVYIFAATIYAPFYVAMGYALYRQARYDSEAHDLREDLRRLAKRLSGSLKTAAVLFLLTAAFSALAPAEIWAAGNPSGSGKLPDKAQVQADRDASTGSAPFAHEVTEKHYSWKNAPDKNREKKQNNFSIGPLRILAYFVSGLTVILVCAYILRSLYRRGKTPPPASAEILFMPDTRTQTLPENLSHAAARLAQSNPRAALSLLLRGLVAQLSARPDILLAPGMTEKDIENLTQQQFPAFYPFTRTLMHHWTASAYARRPAQAEHILRLCADYRQLFENGAAS